MSKPSPRRSWTAGDPLPSQQAARTKRKDGYILVTWRDGEGQRWQAFDHRLVVNAPKGWHVHHKNGIRDDNRPENLELLRPGDHHRHHNTLPELNTRRDIDDADIIALHLAGASALHIADRLGCSNGLILGRLRKNGYKPHPPGRQLKKVERRFSGNRKSRNGEANCHSRLDGNDVRWTGRETA